MVAFIPFLLAGPATPPDMNAFFFSLFSFGFLMRSEAEHN
jgi:hypothetical protein